MLAAPEVILVDEYDQQIGTMGKLDAHVKGLLHRAFSVFIMNDEGKMLLHKRALQKYHSGGLWSNACCSHPAPGEAVINAAYRRLNEEMGFTCELNEVDFLKYFIKFENGLIEHEYDHLILGQYSGSIHPNPDEVSEHQHYSLEEIDALLKENEQMFTFWFRITYPIVKSYLKGT